jgi:aminoglycoside 3-N-acetyltransferase
MNTSMDSVEKSDILQSLTALCLDPGDCVMVHSSLSSFGHVKGGAETVIDSLLETVGTAGTLVMPTLCQKDRERRFETWDIESSPSDVGRITEVFRLSPGVIRSDHATHSVAAKGPEALSITQGHRCAQGRPGPWGAAAFGIGCPYDRLYELQAKILLIGVDFRYNTLVHYIEHLVVEEILKNTPASLREEAISDLRGWNREGAWPFFDRGKLQQALDENGAIRRGVCGNARLILCGAKHAVDQALTWMKSDPAAWFDAEFMAWLKEHVQ